MLSPLLVTAFAAPAQSILNLAVKQDPVTARALKRFEGKTLLLECTGPVSWQIYILVGAHEFALQSVYEGLSDAKISGSVAALTQLVLSKQQSQALFKGDIKMSGDTSFVQELFEVMQKLDIDWEDHFSRVFGDIATHKFNTMARETRQWSANSLSALIDDTEEYLHEEARLLPTRSEVRAFSDSLDNMRMNVDRIAARLGKLEEKLAARSL